jgi:uncharacterized membrane protein
MAEHSRTSGGRRVAETLRNYLLTGLLALGPTAITLWVFFRLLNWVDLGLGRYLRFPLFDYRRIPGLGLLATLFILIVVGVIVSALGRWIGARSLLTMWEQMLTRIPGVGILYGSTKSIGEAFVSRRRATFKQVVLLPWPHPGVYRIGFVAGSAGAEVRRLLHDEIEVVFVPHTPNPASGFVHYVSKSSLVYVDWSIEEALRAVVSGGVVQPEPTLIEPATIVPRGVTDTAERAAAPGGTE